MTAGTHTRVLIVGAGPTGLALAIELGSRRIPLAVLTPRHSQLPDLYEARYVLIRPDQHIAWRGDVWPRDGAALLRRVTGR